MQPKSLLAPLALSLTLGACTPLPGAPAECTEGAYASLVGRPLAAVSLPAEANIRVIQPDSMVTQDYVPSRTNIVVDDAGTITRVYCG